MINALHQLRLRADILKMEQIVKSFSGESPTTEIRKEITRLINEVCVFEVTDMTTPEDIDKGEFKYEVSIIDTQQEVIINFMY